MNGYLVLAIVFVGLMIYFSIRNNITYAKLLCRMHLANGPKFSDELQEAIKTGTNGLATFNSLTMYLSLRELVKEDFVRRNKEIHPSGELRWKYTLNLPKKKPAPKPKFSIWNLGKLEGQFGMYARAP